MPSAVGAPAITAAAPWTREGNSLPFWCLAFFTFILYIAPQLMFSVLTPLHLAKVSAGLAIAVYLLDRLSRRQPLSVDVPAVRLVLVLTGLAILSIPLSLWPGGSVEVFQGAFIKSVAIFFLLANAVDTPRRMRTLLALVVAFGVIIAAAGIRDFAAGNLAVGGVRIAGYASPLAGNPNDLALTLNLILALATGLHASAHGAFTRLVLLGVMGLLVAGVIASFSRGGFLTLGAILAALLWRRVRERGIAAVLPFLALGAGLFVLPGGYSERVYSIFDFSLDPTGSASARWEGMRVSLTVMLENPVLGVGLGQDMLALVDEGFGWVETHNAFLQAGADLGVPGFVVYVLLVRHAFKSVRQARREFRGVPDGRTLLALGSGVEIALVAYTVGALFHPVAYHFYFFYLAGFAVALREMARRANRASVGTLARTG